MKTTLLPPVPPIPRNVRIPRAKNVRIRRALTDAVRVDVVTDLRAALVACELSIRAANGGRLPAEDHASLVRGWAALATLANAEVSS